MLQADSESEAEGLDAQEGGEVVECVCFHRWSSAVRDAILRVAESSSDSICLRRSCFAEEASFRSKTLSKFSAPSLILFSISIWF